MSFEQLRDALKAAGLMKEAASKFCFGVGFVGRQTQATIVLSVVLCVICYMLKNEWMIFGLAIVTTLTYFRYSHVTAKFAHEHPDHALMEGATLASWQKSQLAASKDASPSINEASIERPKTLDHLLGMDSSNANPS